MIAIDPTELEQITRRKRPKAQRRVLDATALAGHADAKMTERYIRKYESVIVQGPRAVKG